MYSHTNNALSSMKKPTAFSLNDLQFQTDSCVRWSYTTHSLKYTFKQVRSYVHLSYTNLIKILTLSDKFMCAVIIHHLLIKLLTLSNNKPPLLITRPATSLLSCTLQNGVHLHICPQICPWYSGWILLTIHSRHYFRQSSIISFCLPLPCYSWSS